MKHILQTFMFYMIPQLLLTACILSLCFPAYGQREQVHSDRLRFTIQDASYLNSYDARIIPKVKTLGSRYSFKWTGPDGFISTDSSLVNIAPGTYVVRLNDGRCSFLADTIEVLARNNAYQNEKSFVVSRVHPNPFMEDVEIQFRSNTAQIVHLEIFFSNGQVYSRRQISLDEGETTVKLDMASAPAGIYVLNFCNASNCKMTERIIKMH